MHMKPERDWKLIKIDGNSAFFVMDCKTERKLLFNVPNIVDVSIRGQNAYVKVRDSRVMKIDLNTGFRIYLNYTMSDYTDALDLIHAMH